MRSGASRRCPGSLGEAVEALAGSELMRKALGEHIFPRYVELKRREWNEYRIQVSEWEKTRAYLHVAVAPWCLAGGAPEGTGASRSGAAMAHDLRCRRSRKASGAVCV